MRVKTRTQNQRTCPRFLKATALVVSFCFATTTIAWSAPEITLPLSGFGRDVVIQALADKIDIPEDIGQIQERYVATVGARRAVPLQASTIVHIQDAHAHYEAQRNIQKMLERLNKEYGFDLIFLEGAFQKLDANVLNFFKDPQHNKKMVDLLTQDGIVGGASRFLRENLGVEAYGVEDFDLYKKNLAAFQTVIRAKDTSDDFLQGLKSRILTESSHVSNKKLKGFFREWMFYQDIQTELMRHLNTLEKYAKAELEIDFEKVRTQLKWPQLVRFFKLRKLEKEVNREKAKQEKQAIMAWGRENDLEKFIEGLEHLAKTEDGPRHFLEKFYDAASHKGFTFEQYPEFTKQAGTIILQDELKATRLFEEAQRLTDLILNKLAESPEEKEIISIYKDYLLLKMLFSLELTHNDYIEIKSRQEELKSLAAPIDALFNDALDFYAGAKAREEVMFQNMTAIMKQTGKTKAALIAGGFHSEGLTRQFKKNGLSYVEMTPHISEVTDNKTYLNVMTLQGHAMPKESTIGSPELIITLPIAAELDPLGARAAGYFQIVIDDARKVTPYKTSNFNTRVLGLHRIAAETNGLRRFRKPFTIDDPGNDENKELINAEDLLAIGRSEARSDKEIDAGDEAKKRFEKTTSDPVEIKGETLQESVASPGETKVRNSIQGGVYVINLLRPEPKLPEARSEARIDLTFDTLMDVLTQAYEFSNHTPEIASRDNGFLGEYSSFTVSVLKGTGDHEEPSLIRFKRNRAKMEQDELEQLQVLRNPAEIKIRYEGFAQDVELDGNAMSKLLETVFHDYDIQNGRAVGYAPVQSFQYIVWQVTLTRRSVPKSTGSSGKRSEVRSVEKLKAIAAGVLATAAALSTAAKGADDVPAKAQDTGKPTTAIVSGDDYLEHFKQLDLVGIHTKADQSPIFDDASLTAALEAESFKSIIQFIYDYVQTREINGHRYLVMNPIDTAVSLVQSYHQAKTDQGIESASFDDFRRQMELETQSKPEDYIAFKPAYAFPIFHCSDQEAKSQ